MKMREIKPTAWEIHVRIFAVWQGDSSGAAIALLMDAAPSQHPCCSMFVRHMFDQRHFASAQVSVMLTSNAQTFASFKQTYESNQAR